MALGGVFVLKRHVQKHLATLGGNGRFPLLLGTRGRLRSCRLDLFDLGQGRRQADLQLRMTVNPQRAQCGDSVLIKVAIRCLLFHVA